MSINAAYATLLTKTSYLPGVLVLDHGLRQVRSRYPLVVMITPGLPKEAKEMLDKRGIRTRPVQSLMPREGSHTLSAHDDRFTDTWTKLRGFELAEFDRVVLLDCDMIVCRNMDELMDLELGKNQIAAAHVCACNPRKLPHYPKDWVPANCAHSAVKNPFGMPPVASKSSPRPYGQLNSGTVVLNPSKELFSAIEHFLLTTDRIGEFAFPDQDLLTAFFDGTWKPLPWYYNALRTLRYVHTNLWDDKEVRCLHYILPDKPWQSRIVPAEVENQLGETNRWWWAQYDELVGELKVGDPEGWKLVDSNVDRGSKH